MFESKIIALTTVPPQLNRVERWHKSLAPGVADSAAAIKRGMGFLSDVNQWGEYNLMQNSGIEEQKKKLETLILGSKTIMREPFFDFNGSNVTVSLIKVESFDWTFSIELCWMYF